MSNDFTREDYHETVESIAKEAMQEKELDRNQFINESVDSNSYIFMYAGPPVVKEASDNFPTGMQEIAAMAGPDADFDKLLQVAAYMAMEADVYQAVEELEDDYEECNKCGCMIDTNDVDQGEECAECDDFFCDGCLHISEHDEQFRCKKCHEIHYMDIHEPNYETDAFYTPSGPLGSKTSISFCGHFLGEFDTDEEAFAALRKELKGACFFPSVWFIDDHGGYRPEEDFNYDD